MKRFFETLAVYFSIFLMLSFAVLQEFSGFCASWILFILCYSNREFSKFQERKKLK